MISDWCSRQHVVNKYIFFAFIQESGRCPSTNATFSLSRPISTLRLALLLLPFMFQVSLSVDHKPRTNRFIRVRMSGKFFQCHGLLACRREAIKHKSSINLYMTSDQLSFFFHAAPCSRPVTVMCFLYFRIWRETKKRQKDLPNLQAGGGGGHQSIKKDSSKRSNSRYFST